MNTIPRLLLSAVLAASAFTQSAHGEQPQARQDAPSSGIITMRGHDAQGRETLTVIEVPRRAPAEPAPVAEARAQGLPIYGAVPELPVMRPSWWANFRPSERPSRQIEHVTGVVVAGYLR